MDRLGRSTGGAVVAAQHDDAALKTPPPKHLGGGEAGRAAADDDDPVRRVSTAAATLRLALGALLAHENPAVPLLDLPAVERIEGRRVQGLAGAKVEAGVVPGTAHRVADDEPVGERAVIVGAMGADREDLGAAAHQQHLLLADMAEQLAAVIEFGKGNSLPEIGTGGPRLIVRHSFLPWLSSTAAKRSDFSIKESDVRRARGPERRRRLAARLRGARRPAKTFSAFRSILLRHSQAAE